MKTASTPWMTMASALAALAALSLACSSSSSDGGGAGGSTGADSGPGTGGKMTGVDAAVAQPLYTFDNDISPWVLNNFPDSPSRNLGATYATDGGGADAQVFGDGGVVLAPTIGLDSVHGSPAPGSLKVTATFTDCNQYVDAIVNVPVALNLTGKIVQAQLAVISGGFSGGAQLHISTGTNFAGYVKAPFTLSTTVGAYAITALDTTVAKSDTSTPADYTSVVQIGVQIFSGSACTPAMPYTNAGELVTFSIDSITD